MSFSLGWRALNNVYPTCIRFSTCCSASRLHAFRWIEAEIKGLTGYKLNYFPICRVRCIDRNESQVARKRHWQLGTQYRREKQVIYSDPCCQNATQPNLQPLPDHEKITKLSHVKLCGLIGKITPRLLLASGAPFTLARPPRLKSVGQCERCLRNPSRPARVLSAALCR